MKSLNSRVFLNCFEIICPYLKPMVQEGQVVNIKSGFIFLIVKAFLSAILDEIIG